jgi:hydroxylamine reductase (hybrid-cluster protein)
MAFPYRLKHHDTRTVQIKKWLVVDGHQGANREDLPEQAKAPGEKLLRLFTDSRTANFNGRKQSKAVITVTHTTATTTRADQNRKRKRFNKFHSSTSQK